MNTHKYIISEAEITRDLSTIAINKILVDIARLSRRITTENNFDAILPTLRLFWAEAESKIGVQRVELPGPANTDRFGEWLRETGVPLITEQVFATWSEYQQDHSQKLKDLLQWLGKLRQAVNHWLSAR